MVIQRRFLVDKSSTSWSRPSPTWRLRPDRPSEATTGIQDIIFSPTFPRIFTEYVWWLQSKLDSRSPDPLTVTISTQYRSIQDIWFFASDIHRLGIFLTPYFFFKTWYSKFISYITADESAVIRKGPNSPFSGLCVGGVHKQEKAKGSSCPSRGWRWLAFYTGGGGPPASNCPCVFTLVFRHL